MRTLLLCGILLAALAAPMAARAADEAAIEPTDRIVLFDGKSYEGWVRYLPKNADVEKTWTIKPDGVLYCAGNPAGYVRTEKPYKNYRFHVEYRWPAQPGNSGVLVHTVGPDQVWPKSLECQGGYQSQGDFWEIGGWPFNEHKSGGKRVSGRRVEKYGQHNEKQPGEWNVYEVWAVGDTVRPYINGKLMNEATGCEIQEGKICLQSEGSQIEFRNIWIEPAKDNPWPVAPKEKIVLFNGKDLDGWVRFIPDDKQGPDKQWTVDKVWSVRDGAIRCEGVPNGYIRTTEDYGNYKLHVEWRWPGEATNSGVLLHKQGIDRVWPTVVEAQLMNQNAGDFWLLTSSTLEVDGKQYGPGDFVNVKKKQPTSEKPLGEWNTYDIVCDGGTVRLTVNGVLQNEGTKANPSHGPILLQSEGSPIEFRNVYLEPLGK